MKPAAAQAAYALEHGLSGSKALEFAETRLGESHVVLPFGDKFIALPRTAVGDPQEASDAFAWWTRTRLPQLAAAKRIDPDHARLIPLVGVYGRNPLFYVGDEVTAVTDFFDIPQMIAAFRKAVPKESAADRLKSAQDEAQRRREALAKDRLTRVIRHNP